METHPAWLKKSNIPLTIVCGPPCAGKSTFVRTMAEKGDVVIDLDGIQQKIDFRFRPWMIRPDEKVLHRAIKIRNLMLAGLAKRVSGCAWFIIGAPTQKERAWWQGKLGGEVVLLNPGIGECKRRAYARGTPLAAHGAVVWAGKATMYWAPPVRKRPIRIDGWFADGEDMDEADIELAKGYATMGLGQ